MGRLNRSASDEVPVLEIEVFAVDVDGALVALDQVRRPGSELEITSPAVEFWDELERDSEPEGHDWAHALRAKPGPRLGVALTDSAERRGSSEDIVQPVAIRPESTSELIGDGHLFDESLPRLQVEPASLEVDSRGAMWTATLRTSLLARRRARLRIYPSPSSNLTIIELIPTNPSRLGRRRFVGRGVVAIEALGRRLERKASHQRATAAAA